MSVSLHGRPVICASNEFARFPPPPGQTCQSYTQAFIAQAGGYVQNGSDGLCEFCQYANGDEFLAGFNIFYSKKWFYWGVSCIFLGLPNAANPSKRSVSFLLSQTLPWCICSRGYTLEVPRRLRER